MEVLRLYVIICKDAIHISIFICELDITGYNLCFNNVLSLSFFELPYDEI